MCYVKDPPKESCDKIAEIRAKQCKFNEFRFFSEIFERCF